MSKIFGAIWAVWAGICFMLLMVIIAPAYWLVFALFGQKAKKALLWMNFRVWAPMLLALYLVRYKVYGKSQLNKNQAYVVVSNHQSQLDILANATTCPFLYFFLAKKELSKVPLFGYIAKNLGILVDRSSPESRTESMRIMTENLAKGNSIFLYPEGTRNKTDELLKQFYKGAFRLAINAQVPIAVQTLVYPRPLSPADNMFYMSPGIIHCHWEAPIDTTGMTMVDMPALMEQVRQVMEQRLLSYKA